MEAKWKKLEEDTKLPSAFWLTDGKLVERWACDSAFIITGRWTHWMPAEPTPEPPREPTQAELDEKALNDWIFDGNDRTTLSQTWRAALAYERAEIAKMLPVYEGISYSSEPPTPEEVAIHAIRARCNGGSSK